MNFEESTPKKKSLGSLRKAQKTKPRSPDLVGKLRLQRHTIEVISTQLKEKEGDEIECCIAGWRNDDQQGQYLTVELSPLYVSRHSEPTRASLLDFICDGIE